MKLLSFSFERCSTVDGPLIRDVIFLKGCRLHCPWCHNEEGKDPNPQIFYYPNKCKMCGLCTKLCPNACHEIKDGKHLFDTSHCTFCQNCVKNCPYEAIKTIGEVLDEEYVLNILNEDKVYFNGGGGLTITGGEPFNQIDALIPFVKKVKKLGISIALETSLDVTIEDIKKIIDDIDLFLIDIKTPDEKLLEKVTGLNYQKYIDNLSYIYKEKPIILRCPLIKEINMREEDIILYKEFFSRFDKVQEIDFLPYHDLGISKTISLGQKLQKHFSVLNEKEYLSFIKRINIQNKTIKFGGRLIDE